MPVISALAAPGPVLAHLRPPRRFAGLTGLALVSALWAGCPAPVTSYALCRSGTTGCLEYTGDGWTSAAIAADCTPLGSVDRTRATGTCAPSPYGTCVDHPGASNERRLYEYSTGGTESAAQAICCTGGGPAPLDRAWVSASTGLTTDCRAAADGG